MELDGSDDVIDRYIRGNRLIKIDDNGYYLYNAHGDVIQLADQQGTVTRSYLYDAFGVEQGTPTIDTNPFRYCGEYLDIESGNVYLRARYYDPSIGRFISEDSVKGNITNPLSLNLYTYCNNNPVNYIDPSGHETEWDRQHVTDPTDLENITNAGNAWSSASVLEKSFLHSYAERIRDKYRAHNEVGTADGNTITIPDVTDKLNGLMLTYEYMYSRNHELPGSVNLVVFKELVQNKGELDLKNQPDWQYEKYIYNGKIVDKDVPANIMYGYLGKVMNIPDTILYMGAGYAQTMAGTGPGGTGSWQWVNLTNFGDDPRDTSSINQGIQIYNNWHK